MSGGWGSWSIIDERLDPSVLLQQGDSCGQCAVRSLLMDVAVRVSLQDLCLNLGNHGQTTAAELATLLQSLHPDLTWAARQVLNFGPDRHFALFHPYPWIAMMKQYGRTHHWLVVHGLGDSDRLDVRDSATGTRYSIEWRFFEPDWNRILVSRHEHT